MAGVKKEGRAAEIRKASRDALTVGMGYIPLGAGFGMLLVSAGFQWWWATISGVLVFSGSLAYLGVGVMTAGASFAAMASTTFFVNFRHVFYGLSFPLHLVKSPLARAYCVHALTDEAYAVISTRPRAEMTGYRVFWTQVFCHGYWITGCTLGALVGQIVPLDPQILEFTLTALFIILTIDAYRAAPSVPIPIIAIACSVVAMLISKDQMLLMGLTAFAAIMLARALYVTKHAGVK